MLRRSAGKEDEDADAIIITNHFLGQIFESLGGGGVRDEKLQITVKTMRAGGLPHRRYGGVP